MHRSPSAVALALVSLTPQSSTLLPTLHHLLLLPTHSKTPPSPLLPPLPITPSSLLISLLPSPLSKIAPLSPSMKSSRRTLRTSSGSMPLGALAVAMLTSFSVHSRTKLKLSVPTPYSSKTSPLPTVLQLLPPPPSIPLPSFQLTPLQIPLNPVPSTSAAYTGPNSRLFPSTSPQPSIASVVSCCATNPGTSSRAKPLRAPPRSMTIGATMRVSVTLRIYAMSLEPCPNVSHAT
jgi:hypothetical protein